VRRGRRGRFRGHRVSAKRENNATTWFRLVAGKEGAVRIPGNFGGRELKCNRRSVKKAGVDVTFVPVKGAGHGFGGPQALEPVREFLSRVLK